MNVWEQTNPGGPAASFTIPYHFESCRSYEIELWWKHESASCTAHDSISTTTIVGVEPPAGLEAWWTGDHTKNNQTKSLHHGRWMDDGTTPSSAGRYAPGKVQDAFDFEGATRFVEIPDSANNFNFNHFNFDHASAPGQGVFSIDAWVYDPPAVGSARQPIFYNLRCDRLQGPDSGCGSTGTLTGGYGFEMWNSGSALSLRLVHAGFGLSLAQEAISQPVPLSGTFGWHFVAVTVDRRIPNGVRFYVDGVDIGCASGCTVDSAPIVNQFRARIGADEGPNREPYRVHSGRIDELEFFRSLLTANDIARIYAAGQCGKCRFGYQVEVPEKSHVCPGDSQISRTFKVCNETDSGQEMDVTVTPTLGIQEGYFPAVCNGGNFLSAADVSLRTNNQSTAPGRYDVDARKCTSIIADINTSSITSAGDTRCYGIEANAVSGDGSAYQVGTVSGIRCVDGFPLDLVDPVSAADSMIPVTGGGGGGGPGGSSPSWTLGNTTSSSATIDYSLAVTPIGREDGAVGLSLGGLLEGVPYQGTLVLGPGNSTQISTNAAVIEYRPKDLYRFTLSLDTDQDGIDDLSSDAVMEPILVSNRCPEDFDHDRSGAVGSPDLALLLAALGGSYGPQFDHDHDEQIDAGDVALWQDCSGQLLHGPVPGSTPLIGPMLDRFDVDGDGFNNLADNCPYSPNPQQEDADFDGVGNACESVPSAIQEWVRIGHPENQTDAMGGGFGAVPVEFDIGKHEVTNVQYAAFLNAVAAEDPNGLFSASMQSHPFGGIQRFGSPGSYSYVVKPGFESLPINFVTFWDAARYVNWLSNDSPAGVQSAATTEDGAYLLTAAGINDNTVIRKPGATVFIPTTDEWYKAAFYDGQGGYFPYPTQSFAEPTCTSVTTIPNAANCEDAVYGPTAVGAYIDSESGYRTNDQGGNVAEWNESIASTGRVVGGGGFDDTVFRLSAFGIDQLPALSEGPELGFRVAQSCGATVPEPTFLASLIAGAMLVSGLVRMRRP